MTSRRNAIAMSPTGMNEFLDSRNIGVLSTIGLDGMPHLVSIAYMRSGSQLLMVTYGKSQKLLNLSRDPRAAFLVEIQEPYSEIRGVMIRGTTRIIDDPQYAEEVSHQILAMARAEGETQDVPVERIAVKRRVIQLELDRCVSWDHRRLDGAY